MMRKSFGVQSWFYPIAFGPAHSGYRVPGERVGDAFRDGLTLK